MGFNDFNRVWATFSDFYRVLPSFFFVRALPSFANWALPSFTEFSYLSSTDSSSAELYRVSPSFTELYRVIPHRVSPNENLPSFTEFSQSSSLMTTGLELISMKDDAFAIAIVTSVFLFSQSNRVVAPPPFRHWLMESSNRVALKSADQSEVSKSVFFSFLFLFFFIISFLFFFKAAQMVDSRRTEWVHWIHWKSITLIWISSEPIRALCRRLSSANRNRRRGRVLTNLERENGPRRETEWKQKKCGGNFQIFFFCLIESNGKKIERGWKWRSISLRSFRIVRFFFNHFFLFFSFRRLSSSISSPPHF